MRRAEQLRTLSLCQQVTLQFTGAQFRVLRHLMGLQQPPTRTQLSSWVQRIVRREILRLAPEVIA